MSLPPSTIRIKRKAGEDVEFLCVEGEIKRQKGVDSGDQWIYRRRRATVDGDILVDPFLPVSGPSIPVIQATEAAGKDRPIRPARRVVTAANVGSVTVKDDKESDPAPPFLAGLGLEKARRFHLSSAHLPQHTAPTARKRGAPAVFVERTAKRNRGSDKEITARSRSVSETAPPTRESGADAPHELDNQVTPVIYKRPIAKGVPRSTQRKRPLPPSLQSTAVDELTRAILEYTLNQKSHGSKEEEDLIVHTPPGASTTSTPKFKPKPPAQRIWERDPASHARQETDQSVPMSPSTSPDDGNVSDDEYVTETYERVPISVLHEEKVAREKIGLLVFDAEPDRVNFFYADRVESDDDGLEEDEDENAENHYSADYPDEDLEWEDELGRNPYHYWKGDVNSDDDSHDVDADGDVGENVDWRSDDFDPRDDYKFPEQARGGRAGASALTSFRGQR